MQCSDVTSLSQCQAPITALQALAPGYVLLSFTAADLARAAQPGQFVELRVGTAGTFDPLLARPISIYRAEPETGEMSVIFKVVGRGTALLAARQVGEMVTVLGPIGNGFVVPETARRVALMGGGVGMPPLYFLAERLHAARPEVDIALFYGGRSREDLLELARWEALGVTVFAATDDGSAGHHGLVTAPFEAELARQPFDYVAACGPKPMLRAVQRMALAAGLAGQLSLEERMACGVGACLGCVCATVAGRRRVCVDGPVFALEEVTFHD